MILLAVVHATPLLPLNHVPLLVGFLAGGFVTLLCGLAWVILAHKHGSAIIPGLFLTGAGGGYVIAFSVMLTRALMRLP